MLFTNKRMSVPCRSSTHKIDGGQRTPEQLILSDGWDHHENLPNYIDQSLAELAATLSAFYADMGTGMNRITARFYPGLMA